MTNINPNDIPEADLPEGSSGLLELSDGAYNKLKALVTIILPAISTAFVTVAGLWGMDSTTAGRIVGTLVALTTLLGVVLAISSKKYKTNDARFDGAIDVVPGADGQPLLNLSMDSSAIVNKDIIQLKVNQNTDPSA